MIEHTLNSTTLITVYELTIDKISPQGKVRKNLEMRLIVIFALFLLPVSVRSQETLSVNKSLLRSTGHFSHQVGYLAPEEKLARNKHHRQANCEHVTPRELGFTERDTVTGQKIIDRAQSLGLDYICGLWCSGWALGTEWSREHLKSGQPVFLGSEPLIDQHGDHYIVTATTDWVGFLAIKMKGVDVAFHLDSDWFFVKTPKYKSLKK